MALLITERCINCDMCEPECPNGAIAMGATIYHIDVNRCTECVGHYATPTCQQVCPINHTIVQHPDFHESDAALWQKFFALYPQDTPTPQ